MSSTVTEVVSDFPASSKSGYALEGWFTDAAFAAGSKVAFPYSPGSDVVLTAKWIPCTNGLQYDAIAGGYSVMRGTANTGAHVTVPEYWLGTRVVEIGYSAFSGSTGMTGITLPGGVSSIGTNAFRHCTGLSTVYLNSAVPPSTGALIFEECYALSSIKVPGASVAAYKASNQWLEHESIIVSQ